MNFVGKILILLILVMSLVFMSFAVAVYSTHQNWRETVERTPELASKTGKPVGLKHQLEAANTRNEELQERYDTLATDLKHEREANLKVQGKLAEDVESLTKLRSSLERERDDLRKTKATAVAAYEVAQNNLTKLTTEVVNLRQEVRDIQKDRDKQFETVVGLTDQIHQAQGEIKRLEERRMQLAEQVAAQKKVLTANNLTQYTPVDHIPPSIRGKVVAVSGSNLVEVDLGSDDGLRIGHTLDIFRGNQYLGRVEILTTRTDKSVGRVLPDYKKGVIQEGDNVATRLKVG